MIKKIILIVLFFSFVMSDEIGRYQLETLVYESKKGKIYIVETVFDTKTGKVVKRRKIYHTKYKLPYKNKYNKMVREE
jgi:hypothetical protein